MFADLTTGLGAKRLLCRLILATSLVLSGCATLKPPLEEPAVDTAPAQAAPTSAFRAEGKIGVQSPQGTFSLRFDWSQSPTATEIVLANPWGGDVASISRSGSAPYRLQRPGETEVTVNAWEEALFAAAGIDTQRYPPPLGLIESLVTNHRDQLAAWQRWQSQQSPDSPWASLQWQVEQETDGRRIRIDMSPIVVRIWLARFVGR